MSDSASGTSVLGANSRPLTHDVGDAVGRALGDGVGDLHAPKVMEPPHHHCFAPHVWSSYISLSSPIQGLNLPVAESTERQ